LEGPLNLYVNGVSYPTLALVYCVNGAIDKISYI
jgi:hypothetical protein